MDENRLIEYINKCAKREINLMEMCGTHTHEIKRFGLESLLSSDINLISGPGCPVCVMNKGTIDAAIELAKHKVTIITYGELLKVKGGYTCLKDSGGHIKTIYSPLDLFSIIEKNSTTEFVFLGAGYESDIPVLASVIKTMKKLKKRNISFLLELKKTSSILKMILKENNHLDGIIVPGHVAVITGSEYYKFITDDFNISGAVTGFSQVDILSSIYFLVKHIKYPQFINLYSRVVRPYGNRKAISLLNQVFEESDTYWQGIGNISQSGYVLRKEFQEFDTLRRYNLKLSYPKEMNCICSDVNLGRKKPTDCHLFNKKCKPQHPIGPSMVSSLGTCLACYNHKNNLMIKN